ncbi:putative cytochrome P450 142 [Ktedonobacteria bacterium brp13]|nr:putative cytochrome P450 142 [Ktedonobacteria bacterium brp13]
MEIPSSCPSHHQGNAVDLQQTQVLSPHRCSQTSQHEEPWFFDTLHKQWVITAHVLVKQMLLDTRLQARPPEQHDGAWLSRQQAPYSPQVLVREQLLFFEASEQEEAARQLRRAINGLLKSNTLQQQLLARTSDLLASLATQEHCDIVQQFALPLSTQLSAALLGLEWKDDAELVQWAAWSNAFGDYTSGYDAGAALAGIFQFSRVCAHAIKVRRERKESPHDLLTFLLASPLFARSEQRLIANMQMVFAASHITTEKALSSGIQQLVEAGAWHHVREEILAHPALLSSFVEELLRVRTPTRYVARWATEDVSYEDLHIGRGQRVVLSLEAANVDPAVFACPMDTEWSRRPNSHVAFGAGLHACPGAGLARQELQLIFRLLFQAAVDFQPTDIAPIYRDNPNLGGLSSYYVTIHSLGVNK